MTTLTDIKDNYKEALYHPVFEAIRAFSSETGTSSFAVGGFVRDLLLQRHSKDIDIVVVGDGPEAAKAVAEKLGVDKVSYFKNFGTAMFQSGDAEIEFVGARKESYRKDSRKPIVENGTLTDDMNRRDFTINALALSLNDSTFGDLVDFFDGVKDLKNGIIRTPLDPDITYSDDPLRMMRAIRFSSQLKFDIEPTSFQSIEKQAQRIEIISKERVTDELNKIILSEKPSRGFKLLEKSGLLQIIFPELTALKGRETINGMSHKDNFYHTLEVLDNISENTDDLWLRWSAILHDIAKAPTKRFDKKAGWTFHGHEDLGAKMVPRIFKRMRLPLDKKMKYVQKMVRLHLRPISLVSGEVTDSAVRRLLFEAGDDVEDLMTLCNADITSKNENKVRKYKNNFRRVKDKLIEVEEKDKVRNFQPPVSGNEIMTTFGLKPCSEIGTIKQAIKEAIIEGEIPNEYEAAYKYMLKKGKELGLKVHSHPK